MLEDFNVDKELKKLLKRNGFKISADDYMSITDIYNATIKEQARQYSNYADRVSLLEGILQQTRQGAVPEDIFQTFSDVRHFEFYKRFMGDDERRRMVNILKEQGIPLDVLKGVKVTKFGDTITPAPGVKINFAFGDDDDNSIILEYFEIIKDGETIFDFGTEKEYFDEIYEEYTSPREVEGAKSLYVGRITNTDIGDIKEWVDKNGRTFYTDSRGHRVKVKDGVLQERILWEEE